MINLFARYGVYVAIGALIGEAGWHPWDAWQWWAWFAVMIFLIEIHVAYSAKVTSPRG